MHVRRRLVASLPRPPCHRRRRRHASIGREAKRETTTRRGRLSFDRDYHVHLGGAAPRSLVARWIRDGRLTLDDEIPDLVSASSSSSEGGSVPTVAVRDALLEYRGAAAPRGIDSERERDAFLSAYDAPEYDSLPAFLTLYRAYSRRDLLCEHAAEISRGDLAHPFADVRVSVPHPNAGESPSKYAGRALEEMAHFRACLLQSQELFVTFPRQTFNARRNWDYFASFVDLLESTMENDDLCTDSSWLQPQRRLAFDFAGQPLPVTETLPMLDKLRGAFPSAFICYHHGELCPIPFADRVRDALHLLPYVNRIGHGLCLGLAILGIDPDRRPGGSEGASTAGTSPEAGRNAIETNRDVARECLRRMANADIGVEVSPTCNVTLGGAGSKEVLKRYVDEFLDAGVDVYVGTDDPGFLGTTLEREVAILLKDVDKE